MSIFHHGITFLIIVIVACQIKKSRNNRHKNRPPEMASSSPEERVTSLTAERKKTFMKMLINLHLSDYHKCKLTLDEILNICEDSLKKIEIQSEQDIPWHFLRKLMALNATARNTSIKIEDEEEEDDSDLCHESIHPLDVLCLLLHCSDPFLQQEIISKMTMCQFAVPLLLPAVDGTSCTFMLWAMRDIVKKWRTPSMADSKGFEEKRLVNISMPVFSFVRLGLCNLSKSETLNDLLSPSQQKLDLFVHQAMESGYLHRVISDGLVEIAFSFPGGRDSDIFPEPIAVTNLRGDLNSYQTQFKFLTKISSAVFIFTEHISEKEYTLLSSYVQDAGPQFYFIICNSNSKTNDKETDKYLKLLITSEPSNHILHPNPKRSNKIVLSIQKMIKKLLCKSTRRLQDLKYLAQELIINIDENLTQCQRAQERASEITSNITDIATYKKKSLSLQGELWNRISQIEREMCRMKKVGELNGEDYKCKLMQEHFQLQKQQYEMGLSKDMVKFLDAVMCESSEERRFFLKWLKFNLDDICRQEGFKKDKRLSTTFGTQHFIRELGQFHAAESSMIKSGEINKQKRRYHDLPEIAVNFLLDGFALELIDGEVVNIPLQWISDIFNNLNKKTGGQSKMRVITVLGVQSTGKSTLLNTMFGLQLPVSSGRCTQGAFMTLVKVKENFQEELGCHFLLVIDPEGLKAPELDSLEDSFEHDNELATLVVGLSDITIINIAMENPSDMNDILQIVIHAFIRMKEIGKRPNCHFVHQNVSDVSAHKKNNCDQAKLMEKLNEMTRLAAEMENRSSVKKFSDIIDYNSNKNRWYIPGLWHGVSSMSQINPEYSNSVCELKRHLSELMKKNAKKSQSISEFIVWVTSLWNAVKHERFIFSFQNCLIVEAYNQLCLRYSELEWNFRKSVYEWMLCQENSIKNYFKTNKECTMEPPRKEISKKLAQEENLMTESLEKYFKDGSNNVHLVEKYRKEFFNSVKSLQKELDIYLTEKCIETIHIQKGRKYIQLIQESYEKAIEKKVTNLLEKWRQNSEKMDEERRKHEFDSMWEEVLENLHRSPLKKYDVRKETLQYLNKDMSSRGSLIIEMMESIRDLSQYEQKPFIMKSHYLDLACGQKNVTLEGSNYNPEKQMTDLANSVLEKCNKYVKDKIKTKENYDEMYCRELMNMVNERLSKPDTKNLHMTQFFELDLKLLVLGKAAPLFQKMHDDFVQENDPWLCLEKLKEKYFMRFELIYLEQDDCRQRAKEFCDLCLYQALTEHINSHLGTEIVSDVKACKDSARFNNRMFFQCKLFRELLEENSFERYLDYIENYERFVTKWIEKFILNKYSDGSELKKLIKNILLIIMRKMKATIEDEELLKSCNVLEFLKAFCEKLSKDLFVSDKYIGVIAFQSQVRIAQFASEIEESIKETVVKILEEMEKMKISEVLERISRKPQDELFRDVFGCGKQCPFCKAPCDAGGKDHDQHFTAIHLPQGLGSYRDVLTNILTHSICSTDVTTDQRFMSPETKGKFHPYKDYRKFYPDWSIQPDPSITTSIYWKYVFCQFNDQFAEEYNALPAVLPSEWKKITQKDAQDSLTETYSSSA
ncbi:up-regulator of cell proliferation-like isoform X2 [Dendrobates tinctorius]|uniref:up-regulator of cell proliferation-like isoform X2 n=1 Tax=Dendrobates tinctorius TaxID=92724 RepID=UPI003CCA490B